VLHQLSQRELHVAPFVAIIERELHPPVLADLGDLQKDVVVDDLAAFALLANVIR
jgi:hypothetical protein